MSKNVNIVNKLESLGWVVNYLTENDGKREIYEFRQYSPAGEDLVFTIEGSTEEELKKNMQDIVNMFDIDEHVMDLLIAKKNEYGIPNTEVLLEDAKDIKEMLDEAACAFNDKTKHISLNEKAKDLIANDTFCETFYSVFRKAIETEGEKPERVARDIIRTFINKDDCNEMLISTTGYSFENLMHLAEQEYTIDKEIIEEIDLQKVAEEIVEQLKTARYNDISDDSGSYEIRKFGDMSSRHVVVNKIADEDTPPHYMVYCCYENYDDEIISTKDLSVESLLKVLRDFANATLE